MSSKRLHRWYQDVLSGYKEAVHNGTLYKDDLHIKQKDEKQTIRVPIRKPEHLGKYMAIDEKYIDGSTYTILSNRETGKIALMAKTLKTNLLSEMLKGMNNFNVRSLTRDMAINYDWLGRQVFMNAYHVIDKFHVIKHALDALQSIRIRYRQIEWTKRREYKKKNPKNKYLEVINENGDSTLQLLARARGLLYKNRHEWTDQQKQRSQILFNLFPSIKSAYNLIAKLRNWYTKPKSKTIYKKTRERKIALLLDWISLLDILPIEEMKNLAHSFRNHYGQIANYFIAKESNAKAEALNSRIQRFINVNYGTRNIDFFLFRINIYFA